MLPDQDLIWKKVYYVITDVYLRDYICDMRFKTMYITDVFYSIKDKNIVEYSICSEEQYKMYIDSGKNLIIADRRVKADKIYFTKKEANITKKKHYKSILNFFITSINNYINFKHPDKPNIDKLPRGYNIKYANIKYPTL